MFSTKIRLHVETPSVKPTETRQDSQVASRAYHAPQLHDIGKAGELVQGGGGGNYLDANRSRYY
jgi:hypothetical protein